jgi:enoyl-CoA hydratase/carnithine racemase
MTTPDVDIAQDGALKRIRFNRPAKRNAITVAIYAAMADALAEAETDGTAVVLFSAAGVGFCAGNDLADFIANRPEGDDAPVTRFLRALAATNRILIAAVQGRAVGVGTTMLLHCDFVLAEEDAILQMPFTDLALVPEAGSSLLVPRLVGPQRAAELLLLGEPVPAVRAEALGLVNRVVPAGTGLAEAEALATRLLSKPRAAVLATKRLMRSPTSDLAGRMNEEGAAFAEGLQSAEFAAVVAKFFAAREKAA